ncbi:RNA polymerase sigma factor [Sutcliffiella halmapala]
MEFTTMYKEYYDRLFRVSFSIIRDRQLAEDNVQETFIKAYKKLADLEDMQKVGAWLSVIASRTAIDFIRRERKTQGYTMELCMLDCLGKESSQNVEEEVVVSFLKEILKETLEDFSGDDQRMLALKMFKGLKEREIAKALQMNPSAVKSKIHRARRKLKERIELEWSA